MKTTPRILTLFIVTLGLILASPLRADAPKVGDKAPLFEGKDQDGKAWKIETLYP